MSFDRILGQPVAVALLHRVRGGDRLAHAYIFHGPDGVGKFAAAHALATAALCSRPKENGACGECPDCARVARGAHPNLFVLELGREEKEISIDAVRERLWPWLAMKSIDGRDRWVLIRDAESLSPSAANAFLKTLEEPPPGVRMVLVTARAQSLLPTVRSRCHLVRFGPLPDDVVADLLARTRGLDAARARWTARFAGGSLGAAVRLLDEGIEERWRWAVERYRDLGPDNLFAFAEEVAEFAKDAGTGGEEQRDRVRLVLDLIATFLRDALLLGTGAPAERLSAPGGTADVEALLRRMSVDDIVSALDQIQIAESEIARNANQKLAFGNFLLADGRIPR